jgi:hypothetical protein
MGVSRTLFDVIPASAAWQDQTRANHVPSCGTRKFFGIIENNSLRICNCFLLIRISMDIESGFIYFIDSIDNSHVKRAGFFASLSSDIDWPPGPRIH